MNFDLIKKENCFDKILIESDKLVESLEFLKNNAAYYYDRLNTIIAVELGVEVGKFELIYDLASTKLGFNGRISVLVDRNSPQVPSIVSVFKSAYFDECEIYDMFGIIFENNPNLKRLLMPKGWDGYPLRKDYEQSDKRLAWNQDKINTSS